MKYVIFDFNGTLIDDVDLAVECENECIKHYLKRPPLTREEYCKVFTFPVKKYYENVGFSWEEHTYEEVGAYWFNEYSKRKDDYKLYDGVKEVLEESKTKGNINVLLSASDLGQLKKQIAMLDIDKYFDEVYGIDNIYAGSKLHLGLEFIKDKNPDDCLFIGDTLHDVEVAKGMGVKCILVSKGHQAKEILLKEHDLVVDDIREIEL